MAAFNSHQSFNINICLNIHINNISKESFVDKLDSNVQLYKKVKQFLSFLKKSYQTE